jgi:iron complex outermembrane recepter protein
MIVKKTYIIGKFTANCFWGSILFIALIAGNTARGSAQIPDTLPDIISMQTLDEVVVAAFNRNQNLLEAPGALTHIGSHLIDRVQPSFNVLPVLDYVPGVFAHNGANNTNRITIRGIGARVPYATGKIRAYFNNIPITNGSGETFLQDIDPALIQSMDVIKGPASSVYGAGLGGTIVLKAREPQIRQSGFSNHFKMGSFGLLRNTAMLNLAQKNAATSIVYSRTQSEGYRKNNQLHRNAFSVISQFDANRKTKITGLFSYVSLKSYIPSSIDSLTFANSPQSAARNWLKTKGYEESKRLLAGLSFSKRMSKTFTMDLSGFTIWHDEKEMRPFDVFYQERLSIGSRLKLHKNLRLGKATIDLFAGGEVALENYRYRNYENVGAIGDQGDITSHIQQNIPSTNIFAQADLKIMRWNLSAGINLNHSSQTYQDLLKGGNFYAGRQTNKYTPILSPRLSVGYSFLSSHLVYFTVSHGFSTPSLAETLSSDGAINPEIKPEKSWNQEVGFRGKLVNGALFYDVVFYQMRVQDLLVAERIGEDAWVGKNAGESVHRGLEAEGHWILFQQYAPRSWAWRELSFRANYTWNQFVFTDFIDLDNDYSGNNIPGIPNQILHLAAYKEFTMGFYGQAAYRYVGPMPMNDANSRYSQAYQLVELGAGFKKNFSRGWQIAISVQLNNLFNTRYASMILVNAPSFGQASPRYYYPGLPMNYQAGLTIGFP